MNRDLSTFSGDKTLGDKIKFFTVVLERVSSHVFISTAYCVIHLGHMNIMFLGSRFTVRSFLYK